MTARQNNEIRDAAIGEEGLRAWVRPKVRRMSAGSAEDGAFPNPDGVTQS